MRANLREYFTLITGRTREQADGLHKGKDSAAYRRATTVVEMNAEDMTRLTIAEGQACRLRTTAGQADVFVRTGDLPAKMLFMAMGPVANALIGTDTGGTGMPVFKGVTVEVELG